MHDIDHRVAGAILRVGINLDDTIARQTGHQLNRGSIASNIAKIGPLYGCERITVTVPTGIGNREYDRLELIIVCLELHLVGFNASPAMKVIARLAILRNSSIKLENSCLKTS
jgi:hypothetical protein